MNNYAKRNWSQYNKSLVNRRSISLGLNKDRLDHWVSKSEKQSRSAFIKKVIALQGFSASIFYVFTARFISSSFFTFF
jgi:hypothetical protein